MGKKWYVVIAGLDVGVFETWTQVSPLVTAVSKAQHVSFKSEQEARDAFAQARAAGDVRILPGSASPRAQNPNSPRTVSPTLTMLDMRNVTMRSPARTQRVNSSHLSSPETGITYNIGSNHTRSQSTSSSPETGVTQIVSGSPSGHSSLRQELSPSGRSSSRRELSPGRAPTRSASPASSPRTPIRSPTAAPRSPLSRNLRTSPTPPRATVYIPDADSGSDSESEPELISSPNSSMLLSPLTSCPLRTDVLSPNQSTTNRPRPVPASPRSPSQRSTTSNRNGVATLAYALVPIRPLEEEEHRCPTCYSSLQTTQSIEEALQSLSFTQSPSTILIYPAGEDPRSPITAGIRIPGGLGTPSFGTRPSPQRPAIRAT